jgi:hypothetical protein
MKGNSRRIIQAALRGARIGALVGFAFPFVTGAAFSVVTQDVTWLFGIFTIGTISETVIVWSTVWLSAACIGGIYAVVMVALEIRRQRAIEKEFDAMVNADKQAKNQEPNKSVNADRLFRWRSKAGRLR